MISPFVKHHAFLRNIAVFTKIEGAEPSFPNVEPTVHFDHHV
jgi:hypothetical protein